MELTLFALALCGFVVWRLDRLLTNTKRSRF